MVWPVVLVVVVGWLGLRYGLLGNPVLIGFEGLGVWVWT